jgi:inorganic pyrophosphatase
MNLIRRETIYPFHYGYLENITAGNKYGIDVWIGSSKQKTLTGILCTFDTFKRDAEIKLPVGCGHDDIEITRNFKNPMKTLYVPNPMVNK